MPPVKQAGAAKAAPARVIDLDKARKARAEQQRDPVTLVLFGEEFTLAPEMPADFALLAQGGDMRGAVAALVGDDAERFFALRPSLDDLNELAKLAGDVYGADEGK